MVTASWNNNLVQEDYSEYIRDLRRQVLDLIKELAKIRFKSYIERSYDEKKVSREIALAHTRLQEAHLWLGEAMFHLRKEEICQPPLKIASNRVDESEPKS